MARSRTLAELETFVRREADMVNSAFVSSDEVRDYINESWAQLYDRVCLFDQEYFLRSVDFGTTGTGAYDLLNAGKTGVVRAISIVSGGTGYSNGLVQLQLGTNVSASATAVVGGGGTISSLTLLESGDGYTTLSDTSDYNTLVVVQGAVVSASVTATIESDFYKVKGVWFGSAGASSGMFWNPLKRMQWDELNMFTQAGIYAGTSQLALYRVISDKGREKLLLAPDRLSGSLRVWYYPAPPIMLNMQDRIDGRAGWDDWVIKDVAIKCLLKEESIEQAASLKAIRDEIWSRIQLHASDRDGSQPERVRNVRLLSRRYGYWR